jgi:hypothetical protein
VTFRLYPLRFSFLARETIHFPANAANVLRGAFGVIFCRLACQANCPGARECLDRSNCAYARVFEPSAVWGGPSGLGDWPRPFVFRANHLDGRTVPAGSLFSFDLHLFEMRSPALAYFVQAFSQLASEGLGPGRGRAELREVAQLGENRLAAARVFERASPAMKLTPAPLALSMENGVNPVERVRVRFITPTELKAGHQLAERPDFGILAPRIRDRLSTLRELYDEGPLAIDFRGFGERASRVRMSGCRIHKIELMRHSSRTGQSHPIGGFVGEADYEGQLGEFIPYLRAASWTGVGRQTVWGKGQIQVAEL